MGVKAVLIISVVLGGVTPDPSHGNGPPVVWYGALSAVLLSLESPAEEVFEGAARSLAAGVLASGVYKAAWLRWLF